MKKFFCAEIGEDVYLVSEADKQIASLLTTIRISAEQRADENLAAEEQIATLKLDKDAECGDLMLDIDELQKQIATLKAEMDSTDKAYQTLKDQVFDQQTTNGILTAENKRLEEELSNYADARKHLVEQIAFDPLHVLREMNREQRLLFLRSLAICPDHFIKVDLLLDTTGKLKAAAAKWFGKGEGNEKV